MGRIDNLAQKIQERKQKAHDLKIAEKAEAILIEFGKSEIKKYPSSERINCNYLSPDGCLEIYWRKTKNEDGKEWKQMGILLKDEQIKKRFFLPDKKIKKEENVFYINIENEITVFKKEDLWYEKLDKIYEKIHEREIEKTKRSLEQTMSNFDLKGFIKV